MLEEYAICVRAKEDLAWDREHSWEKQRINLIRVATPMYLKDGEIAVEQFVRQCGVGDPKKIAEVVQGIRQKQLLGDPRKSMFQQQSRTEV